MKFTTYLTIVLLGFLFLNGKNKNDDLTSNKNQIVNEKKSFQNDIKPVTDLLKPAWKIYAKHGSGTPLVEDGIVFLPMGLKFAVNAKTGEKLYFEEDRTKNFFKDNFNDSIVMFNSDERIAYLNLYNGEIIFNLRRIRSWPFYNTPEIVKQNKVCVVNSDKELVYMNLTTMETLWTFKSDSMIYDKIITIKDNIYLSDSRYFYCLSLNGNIEWKIELGEFACSPIVEKDLLYVYVNGEGLYAINLEKRKQEWHFKNNHKSRYIGRKIIVDQNNVYFVGPYLYSIDRFTGEIIGEYTNFKSTLSNRISFINNEIVAYTDSKRMIPNICILSKEGKKKYEFFTSDIFPPQSISFPFSYMDEFEFMFAENIEDNLLIGLPTTVDSLYCFQIKTPIEQEE